MKRPVRSVFLAAALGFAAALSSCTGSGDDPSPDTSTSTSSTPSTTSTASSSTSSPSSTSRSASPGPGGSSSAAMKTYSGSWLEVQYAFEHPADWTVEDTSRGTEPGYGTVVVKGPHGSLASLDILMTWGTSCPAGGCMDYPAIYLGDWAGLAPLSQSGPFVARSMAVDLSEFPQDRKWNDWPDNVRVVTSLTSTVGQPPPRLVPSLMYGMGLVETGAGANGSSQRTVLFISNRDFGTLQEAKAYAASDEHRQIQAMIASFRER